MSKKLKDVYPFVCPNCGAKGLAAPSIFMLAGNNAGHGSCIHCKEFLYLEIHENGKKMIAVPFEEHVDQVREQLKEEEL